MRAALLLSILVALAAIPIASASADLCTKFHVCSECDGNGVCVVVWSDANGVCAGVGFGLQGVGACADAADGCATLIVGFNREPICAVVSLP